MELVKLNEKEKAVHTFKELIQRDPNYVPTYYQLAKTYESLENKREALSAYAEGILVAQKNNDRHALSELQEAMSELEEGI